MDFKVENLEFGYNKIFNIDCLEGMKLIPDESVDAIITSPPYNQNLTTQGESNLYDDSKDEIDHIAFLQKLFIQFKRVLKPEGSIFYNYKTDVANNILSPCFRHLENVNKYTKFLLVGEIVWKYAGNFDSAKCRFPTDYEMVYHLSKTNSFKFFDNGETLSSLWHIKHVMGGSQEKKECGDHPCPYPMELVRKCMTHSTKKGDVVLDPFMGSGTTAVVAKRLNRRYIGFEMRKDFIEIIEKRLKQDNIQDWFG